MRGHVGVLLSAIGLVLAASPAAGAATVVRSSQAVAPAVATGDNGLVAVAAAGPGHRVRIALRGASGRLHDRTLHSHTARIDTLLVAVDERGATTVAWEGLRVGAPGLAYAATLDGRGRLLSGPARVPLGRDMHLFALEAGRGRAVLVANVRDNLQRVNGYGSVGSLAFAGDNYFGAVKRTTTNFGRPQNIGTGDSYAGSGFLVDGRAISGDGSGDLETWPVGLPGGCTQWRTLGAPDRRWMRSAVVLDTTGDGTFVWAGQSNAGPYVTTGDEETNPPTPAPAPLHALVFHGSRGHAVSLRRGAAPAVAAVSGGRAAFAWLDQPAPEGFGGRGHQLPSKLWLGVLHNRGKLSVLREVPGMIADPSVAFRPQVAASSDGTMAVLEEAGRYRLVVRYPNGTFSVPHDVGGASALGRVSILSAGRRIYLVDQTLGTVRVSRVH